MIGSMQFQSAATAWLDLASSVDPTLFAWAFPCTLLACAAIRLGPPRIHAPCAMPFIPALLACLTMASTSRPELYATSCMLACPLLLWAGRPKGRGDSMREILTDSEHGPRGE